jgi:hypothetical protein
VPTTKPAPTPAWTPCDPDLEDEYGYPSVEEGGCAEMTDDPCDGAFKSSRDNRGNLIDAFIEDAYSIDEKRLKDCPQFLDEWKLAKAGFQDGSLEVGKDVKPGTYVTTAHMNSGRVSDCYWERSGKNGRIIANDFVTATKKITVTIRKSDEFFTSRECGNWIPA